PALYSAEPHPELGPTEPELDRFELAVAARADAREMPILAICRGTQALNIVRGGRLHPPPPAARADARETPILSICRGTQALNIVRGGGLHQHLPDISTEVDHRQTIPSTEASHAVAVEPGSQLGEAVGGPV